MHIVSIQHRLVPHPKHINIRRLAVSTEATTANIEGYRELVLGPRLNIAIKVDQGR